MNFIEKFKKCILTSFYEALLINIFERRLSNIKHGFSKRNFRRITKIGKISCNEMYKANYLLFCLCVCLEIHAERKTCIHMYIRHKYIIHILIYIQMYIRMWIKKLCIHYSKLYFFDSYWAFYQGSHASRDLGDLNCFSTRNFIKYQSLYMKIDFFWLNMRNIILVKYL